MRRRKRRFRLPNGLSGSLLLGLAVSIVFGLEPSLLNGLAAQFRPVSDNSGNTGGVTGEHAGPRALPPVGAVVRGDVERVVDGDSLHIRGIATQIRLWGLDAPEWNEKGGTAATRMLERIAGREQLDCTVIDHDRYGRIVGRCNRTDGQDIAALMIRSGTATEYRRYSGGYYSNVSAE